ncbi:protein-tyrosine phosphatase-like protein [Hysterangium stoloniferum]|nr:protein-tyrosine phosphatase-like protein [Hysterangium stoloniferum]
MSQPSWLQTSSHKSHLSRVYHELQSREQLREIARMSHDRQFYSHGGRPIQVSPEFAAYYKTSVGLQASHEYKNRYIAMEPYDRTRVLVPNRPDLANGETANEEDVPDYRYINANWVRELYGGKWWIAAQAPLPHTAHAFLTLVMSPAPSPLTPRETSVALPARNRVHTIVQLTLPVEGGRRRAHPYFSSRPRETMILHSEEGCDTPDIRVHTESEEIIQDAQCVMTDLRLRWDIRSDAPIADREEMQVTHLLYTAWPDFGVPQENKSILNFARLIERVNNRHLLEPSDDPNASPPIIVHCSAGVGRTGSFMAFTSLLRLYSLLSPSHSASSSSSLPAPLPSSLLGPLSREMDDDLIAQEVDSLREQRQCMVQKKEQLVWIYQAVSTAFKAA